MAKHKPSVWLFFIASCVSGLILLTALRIHSQDSVPNKQQHKDKVRQAQEVDTSQFPVADQVDTELLDSKERAKREAKGKKYNRRETAVDPRLITVSDRYEWDPSITSLPVDHSDAVIIGEVAGAVAHLSGDKTGVYSEFTIQICQILKNDLQNPLQFPGPVVAEREGGRIRFPSGQVTLMYVSNLRMPRVGRKYVLFLTHNFPYQVRRDQDYRILTGYELLDGRIVPLESSGVIDFDTHRGKDEQTFLAELQVAIRN